MARGSPLICLPLLLTITLVFPSLGKRLSAKLPLKVNCTIAPGGEIVELDGARSVFIMLSDFRIGGAGFGGGEVGDPWAAAQVWRKPANHNTDLLLGSLAGIGDRQTGAVGALSLGAIHRGDVKVINDLVFRLKNTATKPLLMPMAPRRAAMMIRATRRLSSLFKGLFPWLVLIRGILTICVGIGCTKQRWIASQRGHIHGLAAVKFPNFYIPLMADGTTL